MIVSGSSDVGDFEALIRGSEESPSCEESQGWGMIEIAWSRESCVLLQGQATRKEQDEAILQVYIHYMYILHIHTCTYKI